MKIATGCYRNVSDRYPGAISISCSIPRWVRSDLKRYRMLAPLGFKNDPRPRYLEKFAELLGRQDPNRVIAELTDMADGAVPVILCWENPGEFCHRNLVADWLKSELGILVPEVKVKDGVITEMKKRVREPEGQLSVF